MKWFLNLKTQTKLLSGFSLVAALLVCVGVMGIFGLGKINTRLDDLYERPLKGVAAIMSVEGDMQRVGKALRQSILETSTDGFDKQATLVVEGEQEMLTRLTETEATLQTDEAKASLKRIRELMTTWVSNHQEVLQFVREDRRDLATAKLGAGAALSKEMQVEIEKMRREQARARREGDGGEHRTLQPVAAHHDPLRRDRRTLRHRAGPLHFTLDRRSARPRRGGARIGRRWRLHADRDIRIEG